MDVDARAYLSFKTRGTNHPHGSGFQLPSRNDEVFDVG
jgi:hypothetical protein